jgi:hypothetical protein
MQSTKSEPQAPGFIGVDDPIYTMLKEPAPVNKDTQERKMQEWSNNTSTSGTIASPLNSNSSKFMFNVDLSSQKIRWDTSGLRIRFKICGVKNGLAVDLPFKYTPDSTGIQPPASSQRYFYSVDPFMPLNLFDQLTLKVNNGVTISTTQPGDAGNAMMARVISQYSLAAINSSLSECICGPFGDTSYSYARNITDLDYTVGVAPYPYIVPGPGKEKEGLKVVAVNYNFGLYDITVDASGAPCSQPPGGSSLSFPTIGAEVSDIVNAGTDGVKNPVIVESNPYACDPCLKERTKQWCSPLGSSTRTFTRMIPLNVLFPRLPCAIINNLKKLVIELTFNKKHWDMLVPLTGMANTYNCGVRVLQMDLCLDVHVPAPQQSIENTVGAVAGQSEFVPMYDTIVHTPQWSPGSSVQIPGVVNFDSIFMFVPTDGRNNSAWAVSEVASIVDPTIRADVLRQISAFQTNTFSQWLPFGKVESTYAPLIVAETTAGSADNDAMALARLFHIAPKEATDVLLPLVGVQIYWGSKAYPAAELLTAYPSDNTEQTDSYIWNGTNAYDEHLKVCDRIASRVFGAGVDERIYNGTMPFINLKGNPAGAPTVTSADNTLRIKLNGGNADQAGNALKVVLFCYKLWKFNPDGSVDAVF